MKRTLPTKKPSPILAASTHKKVVRKRPVPKSKSKAQPKVTPGKILKYSFLLLLAAFIVAGIYQYRHGLLYYLGFTPAKNIDVLTKDERKIADLRIYEIVAKNKGKVFGLDVSHYQGRINWDSIERTKGEFPLDFMFIRATQGKDGTDSEFKRNWRSAKAGGFIRGAYHYYRPDENSLKQADNFIKGVKLHKGDLPPVLDIEKVPSRQNLDSLKSGLKRWLTRVENHYGVKPIIYSGESFYSDFLQDEFEDYTVWIANYSFFAEEISDDWLFWQFTDKATVKGINGNVDVNMYNGSLTELKGLGVK